MGLLRTRLRRAEQALANRAPLDPRLRLRPEEAARADAALAALGAEAPAPLDPADAQWVETWLRPRLPAWVAYAMRQRRWQAREGAAFDARCRRQVARSLHWRPKDNPVFEGAARRALERMGLVPEGAAL